MNNKKECRICHKNKLFEFFNKSISGKYGYANECKECRSKQRKKLSYKKQLTGTKICPGCEIKKNVLKFNGDTKNKDGLQTYCKECKSLQMQKCNSIFDSFIKKIFRDLIKNAKKRSKQMEVHITINDIVTLYKKQKGLCALTGIKMTHNGYIYNSDQYIINNWNISIDRINSNKDYTKDNIQLVCAIVNRMKVDLSDDNFVKLCGLINNYRYNLNMNNKEKINYKIIDKIIIEKNNKKIIDENINKNKKKKYCSICKENKSIDDFNKNSATNNGLQSHCKDCGHNLSKKRFSTLDGFMLRLYHNVVHNLKKRAKNLECEITKEDLINLYNKQEGYCKLSGIKMTHLAYTTKGNNNVLNPWNVSVDRIDSTKGYTKNNIQLVSVLINRMKSDQKDEQFYDMCQLIVANNLKNH
jgi:hypothetical protein